VGARLKEVQDKAQDLANFGMTYPRMIEGHPKLMKL